MHLYSLLKTIHKLLICNLTLLDSLHRLKLLHKHFGFVVSFDCLHGTNALLLLFHSVVWADARAVRPYMLIAFSM